MAKASSPVRLESTLMESAAIAGEVFNRSATEQVEFWASIGRLISPKISPNEILELKAGLAQLKIEKCQSARIDSQGLLAEIEQKRQSGSIRHAIARGGARYQASLSHPGKLEHVAEDGSITVGEFKEGVFKAAE